MKYFIIWYLVGLVTFIVTARARDEILYNYRRQEFPWEDLWPGVFLALLGPTLAILFIAGFIIEFLDSDWGNKKLF